MPKASSVVASDTKQSWQFHSLGLITGLHLQLRPYEFKTVRRQSTSLPQH